MTRQTRRKVGSKRSQTPRRKAGRRKQHPQGWHTFTVEKPLCAPCRMFVQECTEPYEIPVTGYREWCPQVATTEIVKRMRIERRTRENLKYGPKAAPAYLKTSCCAEFSVPAARAKWVEDIINYQGQMTVIGGSLDKGDKSYRRGQRRLGNMPTAWRNQPGYDGPRGTGGIQGMPDSLDTQCKISMEQWNRLHGEIDRAASQGEESAKPKKKRFGLFGR